MGKKGGRNKEKGLSATTSALKLRDGDESDQESVYSSVPGDYQNSVLDEDEFTDDATLVDSFAELIENAMDKTNTTRFRAIDQITRLFRHSYVPEIAEAYKAQLCEVAEKGIRRTNEETDRSLKLVGALTLQLGLDIEDVIDPVLASMCAYFADDSQAEELRARCAEMLGLCAYFGIYRPRKRLECLNNLRQIWSTMKLSMAQTHLFSSSLLAWALLLERCEEDRIEEAINESQARLCWYLSSNSIDARISVGEALAVLYELATDNIDEEFRFANHPQLKSTLDELAADSVKYHAKRDKRVQKFTFRQIIDTIFNDHVPSSKVRFNNKRETLEIEGCHSKLLYDLLCRILKGDVSIHLTKNEVLRELFDLGKPLEEEDTLNKNIKALKDEQKSLFHATSKERNIRRAKQRDKKAL
ncbi:hypothetical protein M3Y98_00420700 [Aphelenchoides besseyi]|nr:hypothetical protein M3Y98_00420700 [Aphelenchoides besseyi]KAI6202131.1 hypothetical protein M3Y96_00916000 [Aphelenchoides besseyi]